jgi:predicted nucleic acid-binding protein
MAPPRAVLDTNVLVSGLCFGGKPARVLAHALAGRVRLFTSAVLIDEFTAELAQLWEVIPDDALPRIHHVRADPADDRVLECAVAARADFIVSGDSHLLRLGSFEGIAIVAPAGFLERLGLE